MSKPETAPPEGFYRFVDEEGQIHLVDDLSAIPAAYRASAERVEAKGPRGELFSFIDDDGHQLIADSIEAIPKEFRDAAKKVNVTEAKKAVKALEARAVRAKDTGMKKAREAQREVGDVVPFVKDLEIPSVLFGVALALVIELVTSVFRRTGKTVAKLGMVVLIVALIAGAYFAWIRRVAGLGDTRLASPTAMVDDAKRAAKRMQDKLSQQEKILKKLETEDR